MGALVFAMHKDKQGLYYVLTKEGFELEKSSPQENLSMEQTQMLSAQVQKNNPGLMVEFIM